MKPGAMGRGTMPKVAGFDVRSSPLPGYGRGARMAVFALYKPLQATQSCYPIIPYGCERCRLPWGILSGFSCWCLWLRSCLPFHHLYALHHAYQCPFPG